MIPLVELRGGVVVAKLLGIKLLKANLICIVGNIIPIPFILLFIEKIFAFMKKHNILKGFVEWCEKRAEKKSAGAEKGFFVFLLLFVGIPIPGTGAWMGSLIAALYDFEIKKASVAIFLGIILAACIMSVFSYGLLELFV
ncbi:MAG: small multi-drug export protein [Lachnospiraceae bacterium]|nr:small multi-drug export protein [Lachnospiraceae bacterium]